MHLINKYDRSLVLGYQIAHLLKLGVCRADDLRLLLCLLTLSLMCMEGFAGEDEKSDGKPKRGFIKKAKVVLNGFTLGKDTRLFPYLSLDDWFDPFAGLKLEQGAFWNPRDKMFHHFKFENLDEFSWKFRYQASSLSSNKVKFSFLFKTKFNDDDFFYGIGNATTKSGRVLTTYKSAFWGSEFSITLSKNLVLRWSPGFWKFRSGLLGSGEFERASDAQYVSSVSQLVTANLSTIGKVHSITNGRHMSK